MMHTAHEVFSYVTGGRPPSFSRLISGGNPAGGGKRGKTPPQISRRKDQAGRLGTEEKASRALSEGYFADYLMLFVIILII
jgi:hypothetical protein